MARELYAAARHQNTYRTRVGVSIVGLVVLAGLAILASETQSAEQGRLLFGIISTLAFVYCLFVGVATTADCLSEEKREGTLGLLFLTDLKGYDVVLGKLAVSSLKSFYGLLAIVPVLSLAMLLGGVTASELARVVAVLLNTLFFSLASGVLVSTLSRNERKAMFATAMLILVVAAGPFCVVDPSLISPRRLLAGQQMFLLAPSPVFAIWMAMLPSATPQLLGPPEFWRSLLSTHLLGWLLLILASAVLPRVWSDRPRSGRRLRWWARWQRWIYGGQAVRKAVRGRLLDQNPILWLAGRDRSKLKQVWIFLGALTLLWIPAWFVSFDTVITAAAFLLFCAQGVLKIWVVSEVCSRWVEDRRSGALELLLSSPLSVPDIAHGQKLALRAQFGKAVAIVLALDLLLWVAVKTRYLDASAPRLLTTIPAGMVMFVADLMALRWVALWLALTSKNLGQAMGGAWVRILGLPWLIHLALYWSWSLIFQFAGQRGPELTLVAWTICWLSIGLLFDGVFGLQAKRRFLTEFRELASERFISRRSNAFAQTAAEQIHAAFSALRGAHAPRARGLAPSPTTAASAELPQEGRCAAVDRRGRRSEHARARVLPRAALRRHALVGSLVGATLLAVGWFGWYRGSLARQIKVHLAAIQKAGYPVTEDDLIKWHPPIPSDENAASIIERASVSLFSTQWLPKPAQDQVRSIPTAGASLRTAPLSIEASQALAAFISSNQTALNVVHEITDYHKSRYDSVWNRARNPGWAWWGPAVKGAHELMQLLRLEALLRIEENQPGSAIRSVSALLAVSKSLAQEPMLGPRGLQNIGLNSAASTLECLLTRYALSDRQLQELSERFDQLQTSNRLVRAMAGERYERIHFLELPTPRLLALWVPGMSKWQTTALGALHEVRAWAGMRDRDFLDFLQTAARQMDIVELPFPECLRKATELPKLNHTQNRMPLAIPGSMTLDLLSILVGEAEKESRLRAALAGLAVERYRVANQGRLPETLEELVPDYLKAVPLDPFDGKPIRYKRLVRGYMTYGLGRDEKDDGGQEYKGFPKRQSDVTFTVER